MANQIGPVEQNASDWLRTKYAKRGIAIVSVFPETTVLKIENTGN